MDIQDIYHDRINKLKALEQKGITPYSQPKKFANLLHINDVLAWFKEGAQAFVCGRLMAKREHGKVIFFDIRDQNAKIQVYIKEDVLGKENFELFNALDIGDILAVEGELFKTRTNEPTIKAGSLTLLAKSLKPLPEKWHGLKDVEIRYRQRYVDLIANHEVKNIFVQRAKIISAILKYKYISYSL